MVRLTLLVGLVLGAGPALAQDPATWAFYSDERGASLIHGVPDSDDMRLGLTCERGSGRLTVTFPIERRLAVRFDEDGEAVDALGRRAPWPVEVGVEAGDAGQAFDGGLRDYELNQGSMAEAEAPTADIRAILASAGTARNAVSFYAAGQDIDGSLHEAVTPPPVPEADLDALLAVCG